jgi:hypothetical protein
MQRLYSLPFPQLVRKWQSWESNPSSLAPNYLYKICVYNWKDYRRLEMASYEEKGFCYFCFCRFGVFVGFSCKIK